MAKIRDVSTVLKSTPTLEGAGVHLNRVFGNQHVPMLDPFLLMDEFHSNDPEKYIKGFPWHPHRGIETITYLLEGSVEHADSLGNKGIIETESVQWMTAGSGIIHHEMPKGDISGSLWGFQLWSNLPASHKMMMPRYQEIRQDQIPVINETDGVQLRLICGWYGKHSGPVRDIISDPLYLDVSLKPNAVFSIPTIAGYTVFAYVFNGQVNFGSLTGTEIKSGHLALFEDGDSVSVRAGEVGARFLLISGKPINEPVAWYGPVVMNTDAELKIAFTEYNNGTFLKHNG